MQDEKPYVKRGEGGWTIINGRRRLQMLLEHAGRASVLDIDSGQEMIVTVEPDGSWKVALDHQLVLH